MYPRGGIRFYDLISDVNITFPEYTFDNFWRFIEESEEMGIKFPMEDSIYVIEGKFGLSKVEWEVLAYLMESEDYAFSDVLSSEILVLSRPYTDDGISYATDRDGKEYEYFSSLPIGRTRLANTLRLDGGMEIDVDALDFRKIKAFLHYVLEDDYNPDAPGLWCVAFGYLNSFIYDKDFLCPLESVYENYTYKEGMLIPKKEMRKFDDATVDVILNIPKQDWILYMIEHELPIKSIVVDSYTDDYPFVPTPFKSHDFDIGVQYQISDHISEILWWRGLTYNLERRKQIRDFLVQFPKFKAHKYPVM